MSTNMKKRPNQSARHHAWDLPYGYYFDAKTKTELLFDRHYQLVAERPLEAPWEAKNLSAIKRSPDHSQEYDFEGWFYDDGCPASRLRKTRGFCFQVFGRFMLGYDVRREFFNCKSYKWPDRVSVNALRNGVRELAGKAGT